MFDSIKINNLRANELTKRGIIREGLTDLANNTYKDRDLNKRINDILNNLHNAKMKTVGACKGVISIDDVIISLIEKINLNYRKMEKVVIEDTITRIEDLFEDRKYCDINNIDLSENKRWALDNEILFETTKLSSLLKKGEDLSKEWSNTISKVEQEIIANKAVNNDKEVANVKTSITLLLEQVAQNASFLNMQDKLSLESSLKSTSVASAKDFEKLYKKLVIAAREREIKKVRVNKVTDDFENMYDSKNSTAVEEKMKSYEKNEYENVENESKQETFAEMKSRIKNQGGN